MRILALAILLIGSVCVPAHGQTYGSHFPICLQSYSLGGGRWTVPVTGATQWIGIRPHGPMLDQSVFCTRVSGAAA